MGMPLRQTDSKPAVDASSMKPTRLFSSPREPAVASKWLLIVFAAGVLTLLAGSASASFKARDLVFLLMIAACAPWMLGPAALAALLAGRASSRVEAWLFLGAEMATIAYTTWFWVQLSIVKPDPQNAITIVADQIFHYAAISIYAFAVIAIADFVSQNSEQKGPRIVLLTILSVTSAVPCILIAWWTG